MSSDTLDPQEFRNAMARFASGVTVVTTKDSEGRPAGFTASAFSSLSLNPPLVLVCLDKRAESWEAFSGASQMAISILTAGQTEIAMRFATRGADKFGPGGLVSGKVTGLPLVDGAVVHLECRMHAQPDGGDHTILIGEVVNAASNDNVPMVHFNRNFGAFGNA